MSQGYKNQQVLHINHCQISEQETKVRKIQYSRPYDVKEYLLSKKTRRSDAKATIRSFEKPNWISKYSKLIKWTIERETGSPRTELRDRTMCTMFSSRRTIQETILFALRSNWERVSARLPAERALHSSPYSSPMSSSSSLPNARVHFLENAGQTYVCCCAKRNIW